MATEKNKTNEILEFRSITGIAGLVGLVGGFLFGIWDSITVIVDNRLSLNAFRELLSLSLYSVAIYTVIGCLGMVTIGAVSGIVVKVGRHSINRLQMARIFIAIFVLLAVAVILADIIMFGNIIDITESTVIGIFSGVGIAAFSIYSLSYVMNKRINKEKLIAFCISSFVSLLVLLCCGWWVNLKLLSGEKFHQPISLLANFGLLIVVSLMAVGLNILSFRILQRCTPLGIRRTGYVLLSIILCVFAIISFIGPFSSESNTNDTLLNPADLKRKPNILWIVMDTVRADHLSCYGYYRNTTPNIDKIASEGILFENAISTAAWTTPSHASMFTGMFPSKHGTDSEYAWLEDEFQTIAEVLRLNGYETFGYTNNRHITHKNNMNQGFNTFVITSHGLFVAGPESSDFLKVSEFIGEIQNLLLTDDGAYRTNRLFKRWIADTHKEGTPFFIFINYMEAHHPYRPPRDYVMPYLKEEDVSYEKAMRVSQNGWAYMAEKIEITDEDFEILRALYDGEILYLDFRMGQLFDYLKELNILDNTLLIITSDHGKNFGEHHLMSHFLCLYDTLIHVPLIIRYPELFEAGLRINRQVQLTDIFPTILDIVSIEWDGEDQLQGYSLLKDREQYGPTFAVAEHAFGLDAFKLLLGKNRKFNVSVYNHRLKAIRTEEFKYIWASDGSDELYNIRLDPEELNNLIEAEPEIAEELKAQLKDWLNSFETYRPGAVEQVR